MSNQERNRARQQEAQERAEIEYMSKAVKKERLYADMNKAVFERMDYYLKAKALSKEYAESIEADAKEREDAGKRMEAALAEIKAAQEKIQNEDTQDEPISEGVEESLLTEG